MSSRLAWRFHLRLVTAAVVVVVAAAVAAPLGFASSRSHPIATPRSGSAVTGVVVVDTNLGYEGGQAAGTGMVLRPSGEVLTNNHVIRGATAIRIVVPRTGQRFAAKVVGYDVTRDVAVLQAIGATGLKAVPIDPASPTVGEAVKAVGNADGQGSLRSARGRVTAVHRSITVSDDQGGSEHLTGLIATNAALRAGDSGGPLLDRAGRVIGMDTAAAFGAPAVSLRSPFPPPPHGDGFAIPIRTAVAIARRIEQGAASAAIHVGGTGFLGVEVPPVRWPTMTVGAPVVGVMPGGAAAAAGLVPGDVIIALGGHAISSPSRLGAIVATEIPGAHVSITYVDAAGVTQTATVTLASGPPQ